MPDAKSAAARRLVGDPQKLESVYPSTADIGAELLDWAYFRSLASSASGFPKLIC